MRRPLFLAGSASFLAMVFAQFIGLNASVVFAVFLFISGLCFSFFRKEATARLVSFVLIISALAIGVFSLRTVIDIYPALPLDGQTVVIRGKIAEQPSKHNGKLRYIIKTSEVKREGAPQQLKLMLTQSGEVVSLSYGDEIEAEAVVYAASGKAKSSYTAKGIYLTGYIKTVISRSEMQSKDFYYHAVKLREGAVSVIENYLPKAEGALLSGLLIGVTDSIPEEISESFRVAGLTHMLAVSGQQIATLSQLFITLFIMLGFNKKLACFLTLIPVAAFTAVTGFSFSILRSAIMCAFVLIGNMISRRHDSLSSLGAAVLIILVLNPVSALDAGLQLSAAATLGIITFSKPISSKISSLFKRRTGKALEYIITALSQTLAATLATLPITITLFTSISFVSPLGNVLATLPVNALLPLTLAAMGAHLAGGKFISYPLFLICGLLTKYLIIMSKAVAGIPFSQVSAHHKYLLFAVGAVLLLTGAALIIYKTHLPVKRLGVLASIILLSGTLTAQAINHDTANLHIFDFEKGFAVLTEAESSPIIFGSGYSNYDNSLIKRQLENRGAQKNAMLFIPSDDKIYAKGALRLSKISKHIFLPENSLLLPEIKSANLAERTAKYEHLSLSFGEASQIRTIKTGTGSFFRIKIKETVVLTATENADASLLPEAYLDCDLLITTKSLPKNVYKIRGAYAVVAGSDTITAAAVSRLSALGFKAYATAGMGDITVKTRGNGDIMLARYRS